MIGLSFAHPQLDQLAAFAAGELSPDRRERMARHLQACVRCQRSLRFVRRLTVDARAMLAPTPPAGLLGRVLEARRAGDRRIIPVPGPRTTATLTFRPAVRWAAVAGVLLMAGAGLVSRAGRAEALYKESELRVVSPSWPRPGDTIRVRYQPMAGLFEGEDSLVLRARLRTSRNGSYTEGVPLRAMATLRRARDGQYDGLFALPDSVVFVSLVVEDVRTERIDDHSGKLWEVLTYASDERPSYVALHQRQNDMMGRSWEDGYATARRMTELYPDRLSAWNLRRFYEQFTLGERAADSAAAAHKATTDRLLTTAKQSRTLPEDEIASIFYSVRSKAFGPTATAVDSTEFAYWEAALRRASPRHAQLAQYEAYRLSVRHRGSTAALLAALEDAYAAYAPLDGPGRNITNLAVIAAGEAGDYEAQRLWRTRAYTGTPDSARRLAFEFASIPAFRDEGMTALRTLLAAPETAHVPLRGLTQTATSYRRGVDASRRRTLAALGRALLASGEQRAGLDTLRLATQGSWDHALFRDVATAYRLAGDSASALAVGAKLVVDPQTSEKLADSIVAQGRRRLGEVAWTQALATARREMVAHYAAIATVRSLRGSPRVGTGNGEIRRLRDVAAGRPTVVIFWSRYCGPALEALGEIHRVAARLGAQGTPVVLVVDEPPSADLAAFLTERRVSVPVYHEVDGEMTRAFANFGTPRYYVLDENGRIRFSEVQRVAELLAQAAALQKRD